MSGAWGRRWGFMACLVPAVTACGGVATTVPPSAAADGPITFEILGEGPAVEAEDFDAAYLLPGAAVVHEGTYHLYPVAFSAEPDEPPRVLHLTSADGTTWTGDATQSLLEDFAVDLDDVGAIPSTAFVDRDGTWVMYGGGRPYGGMRTVGWRATAPGPDGPWTAHPNPVLEPDGEGWDGVTTDHPSVLQTADGYLMAYGGASAAAPNRSRIGLAMSTDGVAWTTTASTLGGADDAEALGPSACGVEARTMFEPHLIETAAGHLLVFGVMLEGRDDAMEIHAARSSDGGVTWDCPPEPDGLASADVPGAPDFHAFAVFDGPGSETLMLVEVLGEASSSLWLARVSE